MKDSHLKFLLYLAEKTSVFNTFNSSTIKISKDMKLSQQSISRLLLEMEKEDLIRREVCFSGVRIELTQKAIKEIKRINDILNNILSRKKALKGTVTHGLGEGKYYISKEGYQKQFMKKLGHKMYPGTLNINVKESEIRSFLSTQEVIEISSFKENNRTLGGLLCYKVKVNNNPAFICVPKRTHHKEDTIEIISRYNLRKKLNLKDDDKVMIE